MAPMSKTMMNAALMARWWLEVMASRQVIKH